jgi:hypothetical protein
MAIDPYLIGTAVFGPASVICALGWLGAANVARATGEMLDSVQRNAQMLSSEYLACKSKLVKLERQEEERHAHLKAISRKGNAASNEARRAKRKGATDKTMAELVSTNFRSRPQVVAPVKAKRTRAKNAAVNA